ncbi:hypothetical protein ACEV60_22265 [Enterobacter ludwigii]|uniref:hypothetical protein n=1 Tax=Enterobacter ludwigii TaxID=299767 RepID=UPI003BEF1409
MTVNISIAVINVISFCPVIECSECEVIVCPFDRHYTSRLEKARAEYDEAYKNLMEKEANIRMVALYG